MTNLSPAQTAYLQKQQKHRRMISASRITLLVVFLCLWEIAADSGRIDAFIFSCPSRLTRTCLSMCRDGSLFLHTGITLAETLISFLLVLVIGTLAAVLLWLSRQFSEIMEPYLVVLNSLPKSALAPLLIVWLGANMRTIITAGISVAIFGTIISLYTSFREVDPDMQKLIRTLGGGRLDILRCVILPANIPVFFSTSKINIGLALVGVIIGEFIGARQGLGYLIIYGSQVFSLDWVILSIVILCIIAMGLYTMISLLEKYCQKLQQSPCRPAPATIKNSRNFLSAAR